jgi:hypothetical protein
MIAELSCSLLWREKCICIYMNIYIYIYIIKVELVNDCRIIMFSTLAGEMGLITGPQAMFQLQFHTGTYICVCVCIYLYILYI